MSRRTAYNLGKLYEVHNGLSKASKFFGSGYPFIAFKDVFNNYFIPEVPSGLVQSTQKEQDSYSVKRGDILITRTSETHDELGMSSVALIDYPHATYNGFTKRLRPITDLVHPEFIGYYLRAPFFRSGFQQFSSMTTRASLKNEELLNMRVLLPSMEEQKRLASFLMAYDNLIENNRKQIALLEEAAQRLYKEWFVDLRFPGHQNTEVVDGLPNGWTKCELGAVIHQSGNAEKKSNRENYSHYLPIDSIPSKSITCWDSDAIENASSSLVAFKRDDFVFGAMRPYFHKVIIAPYAGLTRTTCFVLNVGDPDYWAYAFAVLSFGDCVRYATSISVGTTMPYVRWEDLRHMPIVVPTKELAITFKSHFDNIRMRVEVLYKQLAEAREARNRLLPKLMSGEIEVSE